MLHKIRKQYTLSVFTEETALPNPFDQFKKWLHDALNAQEFEATAMVISTVDADLQPHSRVVLLKDLSHEHLVFYTNYESNKAAQICSNQRVAVLFFWPSVERQVRITGTVCKLPDAVSEQYFSSRPVESQLGAWASPQSRIISSYEVLKDNFDKFRKLFGQKIPRPPYWGGYSIEPETFEFWQGRPNRLHDRLFYTKADNEKWKIERLAP
jgi:pyridoxamine 5'-phosphate oxidase